MAQPMPNFNIGVIIMEHSSPEYEEQKKQLGRDFFKRLKELFKRKIKREIKREL